MSVSEVVQPAYAVDEAIGATVNQAMFALHVTRKSLADYLGVTGPAVGRRLRGITAWTTEDLILTAEYLGLQVSDLLPRRAADGGWEPAAYVAGGGAPCGARTHDLRIKSPQL